jgi:HSP20 family protein
MATETGEQPRKGQQETKGAGKPARASRERGERGAELARREELGLPSLFGGLGWSPFGMMRRMMEDMDRMFEDLGFRGRETQRGFWGEGPWTPQVEVVEREGKLLVRADLPGISKDDVHVEVRDDALVLEGERRHEHEEERGGMYRSERAYGSFRRVIPLPEGADTEKCEARFDKGVLEVSIELPKERAHGKRIEIQEAKPGTVH